MFNIELFFIRPKNYCVTVIREKKSGGGYFLKKHFASKYHEVFFHCRLDIRLESHAEKNAEILQNPLG